MIRKSIALVVIGLALSGGGAIAAGLPSWRHDSVFCWPSGTKGLERGVACRLDGSRKMVIVNQHSIIVAGSHGHIEFVTSTK